MRMVMWRESWPLWAVLQGTTAPWPPATTWPTPVPQEPTVLSQTSMLLVSAESLKYHLQWIQTEELKLCFWVHLNIFQNMKCILNLLVFEWNKFISFQLRAVPVTQVNTARPRAWPPQRETVPPVTGVCLEPTPPPLQMVSPGMCAPREATVQ